MQSTQQQQKNALVTGGSSGVGLSITRYLVQAGYHVTFIGRNQERGKRVEAQLNSRSTGCSQFTPLDLSELRSVLQFSQEFIKNHHKLDILANVAGIILPQRQENSAGIDKTLATGYLSAYLLCRELSQLLKKSEHGKIVNVAGLPIHVLNTRLSPNDLSSKKSYSGINIAIKAVHAKTVFTQTLAQELEETGVDVNCFHPGTIQSDLGRNLNFPLKQLFKLAKVFFAKDSAGGIRACSEEMTGMTGHIITKNKVYPLKFTQSYQQEIQKLTHELIEKSLN